MENISIEELEKLAVQERRNYQNQWRKKNREKVRAYNRKQWLRRAAATLTASEQVNNDEHKDE